MITPKSLVQKNIHINEPQSYQCAVWGYQAAHRQMLVRVYKTDKAGHETSFYLFFGGVIYFEGPMHWFGAKFVSGSEEECTTLLRKMGFERPEEAVRSDFYRLFKVKLPQLEVRIVAETAMKLDESEITLGNSFVRSRSRDNV